MSLVSIKTDLTNTLKKASVQLDKLIPRVNNNSRFSEFSEKDLASIFEKIEGISDMLKDLALEADAIVDPIDAQAEEILDGDSLEYVKGELLESVCLNGVYYKVNFKRRLASAGAKRTNDWRPSFTKDNLVTMRKRFEKIFLGKM